MAGLFQVLHGKADGTFRKAEVLKGTDGEPLIIPLNGREMTENICTRPFAVDWDGDGHLDLVVGNFAGTFHLFKGEGKGKFPPKPEDIKAGDSDKPLKIDGHHSDPFAVDWDGDGDLDLLSGSSEGGVQWAENRAGPGKPPRLEPFRTIIKEGPRLAYGQILRESDLEGPTSCTRIWVADVNADGKLDLLVGDMTPLVSPAGKVSEAEFKTRFGEWNASLGKASEQVNDAGKDEKAREQAMRHYQEVYNQRNTFMKEDRTGFVWLYLRK